MPEEGEEWKPKSRIDPDFGLPDLGISGFPDQAILDSEHRVVPVRSVKEWAEWMEGGIAGGIDRRRVASTKLSGVWVSTVFLGLNHGFRGPPLWFETMIFPAEGVNPGFPIEEGSSTLPPTIRELLDGMQLRYGTWDEAVKGHETVVEMIRYGLF